MAPKGGAVFFTCLVLLANAASACIFIFGDAPNATGARPSMLKPETFFDFHVLGQDWGGLCATGTEQSPIDFPKGTNSGYAATAPRTWFYYPDLVSDGNLEVINTGHNIQVQWGNMPYSGEILIPNRGTADAHVQDVLNYDASEMRTMAKGYPAQFHFHTASEHTMEGHYFPLEMHIVNLIDESELPGCDGACVAPVGTLFREVEEGDNPFLEQILKYASMTEGEVTLVPDGESIDLSYVMRSDAKYLQYKGGLTTPPCIEGFLWHVFTQESYVSRSQMNRFKDLVSFKRCTDGASSSGGNGTDASGARKLKSDDGIKRFMLPAEQIHSRTITEPSAGANRKVLQEGDFVCEPAAYGYNNRRVQEQNGRTIMRYAIME
mmetsp:Transcript_4526/g.13104  ORF Transcript_4526/g.13104 Transcript_4526/m.13104 type:complete len:378 (-) Transcript_4526:447-1580(-)